MNQPAINQAEAAARDPQTALISVVMPVFNEQAVLPELVAKVTEVLRGCCGRFEILFVNDGSTDQSASVLDELARQQDHVRVLHLSRNFGHQAAVQAGLSHARGEAMVLMDSDMQDAPEAIARFLDEWRGGYDVVYAIRKDRKESAPKRALFTAFYRVLAAISSTKMPRDAGNFGLIDRRVAEEIVALGERDRYYPGLRSWVGFRQTGIEVERAARYDDHPRVSLWGLFRLAKTAVFSFSTFPLAVFTMIGYAALAIFLALSGYSLACRLFTNLAIPGWTSHILSASFFGAINALGISMLGEYVIRIYDQVRGRPIYLVARSVNMTAETQLPVPLTAETVLESMLETEAPAPDAPYTDLLEQAMQIMQSMTTRPAAPRPEAITPVEVD